MGYNYEGIFKDPTADEDTLSNLERIRAERGEKERKSYETRQRELGKRAADETSPSLFTKVQQEELNRLLNETE